MRGWGAGIHSRVFFSFLFHIIRNTLGVLENFFLFWFGYNLNLVFLYSFKSFWYDTGIRVDSYSGRLIY